ncbi:PAS domain-containing protein [Bradyrhizobium iriomotense]|uniref:histidine kinase n=1 Tax=Bradyrhizobium iriomotense TaxID=441950 RepID=A0ABQ6B078_9BRAD|nr:PAS domain-containing protein [Bradyrhizobium iriomotense]GLR87839.1 histidine kinase [Bradyrhizobium iriomotense]
MNSSDFQLRGVGDPRLAVHATSVLPAWLWSIDGARVVWANPVGAKLFGAANAVELAKKTFGPADPHRRQVAQLGRRLVPGGAVRLERLRGFGSALGTLMTCACARLEFPDGSQGVLVAAMSTSGRVMPLVERLRRLVEGADVPMAAFAPDGLFIGASETARVLLGFPDLTAAGLDQLRRAALAQGRAETPLGIGHMVLQRVGLGADTGLVALYEPGAAQGAQEPRDIVPETTSEPPAVEPPATPPLPDYEQPALVNEAPAEFALFDAFAEPPEAEAPTEEAPETPAAETSASKEAVDNPAEDIVSPKAEPISAAMDQPPQLADAPATPRNQPMRFLWQMDTVGRFVLGSDDFTRLMGAHTAAGFGRLWSEIAQEYALDPEGRVAKALATRDTWAGIIVNWPVDGGERLPVELAGIPIYDRLRNFAGFKGFGVCRDLDGLNRLAALRRFELFTDPPTPQSLSADTIEPVTEPEPEPPPAASDIPEPIAEQPEPFTDANSQQADLDKQVETPPNVVPFRPLGDTKSPVLTPVENSAFNELARQLSERLERERDAAAASVEPQETTKATIEEPPAPPAEEAPRAQAEWLTEPEPPPRGEPLRDRALLDLVPTGILIYRLDRLLYANPAFLARVGHASLNALEEAGGLDALYVAPGVSSESSTSEAGTPVTISTTEDSDATDARLHTITWDGDSAHALICELPQAAPVVTESVVATEEPEPAFEEEPEYEAGQANAEDLAAILDTTAEGIIMFDAEGNIHACNRSAEALFGYDGEALLQQNLTTLFAPESQRVVIDYLDSIRGGNIASLLDHGREVLGRESKGGVIPLAMIMGRTQPDGPNFFAVFRDLSQSKKGESELKQARRLADGAASAKADMLARISHEIRTPLNAIIGFAEVMISERFGSLGNERYGDYMKDIRASGERVIAIIADLSELSRIETGKLDLTFGNVNLNDLVEACVTVMQPQANRERIIIRTSLAHALPQVSADARALRQITMNLIGNSIRLASAGGQVIVSTALTDRGEVALRIRDTGHGLSEREVAAAMEPFRTPPPSDASESAGLSLSLTRALVEANRARFNIKSAANTGTLIEVVFAPSLARA